MQHRGDSYYLFLEVYRRHQKGDFCIRCKALKKQLLGPSSKASAPSLPECTAAMYAQSMFFLIVLVKFYKVGHIWYVKKTFDTLRNDYRQSKDKILKYINIFIPIRIATIKKKKKKKERK